MDDYTATYSPDDNKLRLYAAVRLDDETYQRVKAAGFRWAPRQDLFVAPAWTPAREDLLLELCGEVGDEDSTLADRAEDRADRFEGYQGRRLAEAESAHAAVSVLADSIPLGQPILIGHHSEKRARRDAKRIENGMRKAVRLWDTSEYWKSRAAGAIRHARYVETVPVRLRRIHRIEAERRKLVREYTPSKPDEIANQEPWNGACQECGHRRYVAPYCRERGHDFVSPPAEPHVYCGAARGGSWVPVSALPAIEAASVRWIAHLDRRLGYERAMLGDYVPPAKRKRTLPLILNYRAPDGIEVQNKWCPGETVVYGQIEMTKAELARVYKDYKGTRLSVDGSHRVRFVIVRQEWSVVFLADSKTHPQPEQVAA